MTSSLGTNLCVRVRNVLVVCKRKKKKEVDHIFRMVASGALCVCVSFPSVLLCVFLSDVWFVTLTGCESYLIDTPVWEEPTTGSLCLLPACIAFSITFPRHHLKFLYVVFLCISPHPLILLLYGVDVMNMSKWLPWRKHSFFRKQRKKFSFPLLGKRALFYFLIHKTLLHFSVFCFSFSCTQVILKLEHTLSDTAHISLCVVTVGVFLWSQLRYSLMFVYHSLCDCFGCV